MFLGWVQFALLWSIDKTSQANSIRTWLSQWHWRDMRFRLITSWTARNPLKISSSASPDREDWNSIFFWKELLSESLLFIQAHFPFEIKTRLRLLVSYAQMTFAQGCETTTRFLLFRFDKAGKFHLHFSRLLAVRATALGWAGLLLQRTLLSLS